MTCRLATMTLGNIQLVVAEILWTEDCEDTMFTPVTEQGFDSRRILSKAHHNFRHEGAIFFPKNPYYLSPCSA